MSPIKDDLMKYELVINDRTILLMKKEEVKIMSEICSVFFCKREQRVLKITIPLFQIKSH